LNGRGRFGALAGGGLILLRRLRLDEIAIMISQRIERINMIYDNIIQDYVAMSGMSIWVQNPWTQAPSDRISPSDQDVSGSFP
jgi:hypothetical protein